MKKDWEALRFSSDPPQTPFAPVWDYTIAEKQINIDLEELKNIILQKEIEILESFPPDSDGNTGLGPNSLTSRFKYFNLLKWDYPVVKQLHKEIKYLHSQYCKHLFGLAYKTPRLRIRCWANVLRKNQKIKQHYHSIHPHTYLGGHLTVCSSETSTVYVNPYAGKSANGEYFSKNVPGKLTLFPNYLPHWTTQHTGDEPRITIAFDITTLEQIFVVDKELLLDL